MKVNPLRVLANIMGAAGFILLIVINKLIDIRLGGLSLTQQMFNNEAGQKYIISYLDLLKSSMEMRTITYSYSIFLILLALIILNSTKIKDLDKKLTKDEG